MLRWGRVHQARGLLEGTRTIGDPIAVLPVLFHTLWCRPLHTVYQSFDAVRPTAQVLDVLTGA
ncbi:hypothetical protein [Streptomyces sp. NBC_00316]|uniref:hypothetical protein n=1 Tax=Streptomyces sp. NBC_00316 TaxID=2975710 RepID=UPI002E2D307E|nr:hypothetical protein [Streptomyces sp. NBC_00316]